jgi:hypothetical protein
MESEPKARAELCMKEKVSMREEGKSRASNWVGEGREEEEEEGECNLAKPDLLQYFVRVRILKINTARLFYRAEDDVLLLPPYLDPLGLAASPKNPPPPAPDRPPPAPPFAPSRPPLSGLLPAAPPLATDDGLSTPSLFGLEPLDGVFEPAAMGAMDSDDAEEPEEEVGRGGGAGGFEPEEVMLLARFDFERSCRETPLGSLIEGRLVRLPESSVGDAEESRGGREKMKRR